jgi:hypothetical protein
MSNLTQQMIFDRLPLTDEQRLLLISAMEQAAMEQDIDTHEESKESKEEKEEKEEKEDSIIQQTVHSHDYTSLYNPVEPALFESQVSDSLRNL